MPENTEGLGMSQFKKEAEELINPENDKVIELLRNVEENYPHRYLITGSVGVLGVIGNEFRTVHDLDICIPRQDENKIVDFFDSIGYSRLPPEQSRHLHGNGAILKNKHGTSIDVWFGDYSEEGLSLKTPDGVLFIPKAGLDFPVTIRGIQFKTFSPEVHYFFKDRAVSRNPLNTISPINRKQDIRDYEELKKVANASAAKALLAKGFKYSGRHPLPRIILEKIFDKLFHR